MTRIYRYELAIRPGTTLSLHMCEVCGRPVNPSTAKPVTVNGEEFTFVPGHGNAELLKIPNSANRVVCDAYFGPDCFKKMMKLNGDG